MDNTHGDQKGWSEFESLNGKFTAMLPDKRSISYAYMPELPGLTYLAPDQGGHVAYFIKYVDYSPVIEKDKIKPEEWREDVMQAFLRMEADRDLELLTVENIAFKFFKHDGFPAIRFTGQLGSGGLHDEVIIFANRAIYSICVGSSKGYTSNLQKVLESFVIK